MATRGEIPWMSAEGATLKRLLSGSSSGRLVLVLGSGAGPEAGGFVHHFGTSDCMKYHRAEQNHRTVNATVSAPPSSGIAQPCSLHHGREDPVEQAPGHAADDVPEVEHGEPQRPDAVEADR